MSCDPFLPSYLQGDISQGQAQGLLGPGMANVFHQAQQAKAALQLQAESFSRLFGAGGAAKGALRDGTGKEVKHPKSFIEELQAETNEWLGDSWN